MNPGAKQDKWKKSQGGGDRYKTGYVQDMWDRKSEIGDDR